VVLKFCVQILEVRGCFVFSVTGASGVRIWNRDRHWKACSEIFFMTVTKSACRHIQFGQISM